MEFRMIKPRDPIVYEEIDEEVEEEQEEQENAPLILWTTSRAAEALGVNVKTIRRAMERGEVPGHPVIGRNGKIAFWICMPEELEGYIARGPGRPVREQE